MRGDIPIPGSSKWKLIQAGIRLFGELGYSKVEVDAIAAEAGVTIGSLYHHFKSKKAFYLTIRDDVARRIMDRMEAVAESVPPERALKSALLAAYDGMVKIGVGKLLTEPDPRGESDLIARYLGELAGQSGLECPEEMGVIIAAALRAALSRDGGDPDGKKRGRTALNQLL